MFIYFLSVNDLNAVTLFLSFDSLSCSYVWAGWTLNLSTPMNMNLPTRHWRSEPSRSYAKRETSKRRDNEIHDAVIQVVPRRRGGDQRRGNPGPESRARVVQQCRRLIPAAPDFVGLGVSTVLCTVGLNTYPD